MSASGDFDGHDFADILIGAFATDGTGDNAGVDFIVFGKATGVDVVVEDAE